jgi:type IV pilus assembly protein PilN
MPRINLLPWREEERKKRQRDFLVAMGAAVVAAIVCVGLTIFAYSQMIDGQRARNARLEAEMTARADGDHRTTAAQPPRNRTPV